MTGPTPNTPTTDVERLVEFGVHRRDREPGIALCLSGGGFRASLYHLGALRRLHELGVLQQVCTISSVSGGSIFAAFLATRLHTPGRTLAQGFADWQRDIADPFRAFCARDLRTWPIVRNVLWNWIWPDPLVHQLERRYFERLTQLKLKELPAYPEFILCSTDITFGVNWEFRREGTRDYRAGQLNEAAEWPLARAVAASACFPPLFGPVSIREAPDHYDGGMSGAEAEKLRKKIQLSDGGVYDNMGLEPVWKRWATVLVSDCGAPFDFNHDSAPWRRLLRYAAVVTNQTRALRLRSFFSDTGGSAPKYEGAYWSLNSVADDFVPIGGFDGYSKELISDVISQIRTDLDSFSSAEMSVLENHGYHSADYAVRNWVPRHVPAGAPAAVTPYPEWREEGRVREELRDSGKRVSLRRIWRTVRT